jgi:hypothetical protein
MTATDPKKYLPWEVYDHVLHTHQDDIDESEMWDRIHGCSNYVLQLISVAAMTNIFAISEDKVMRYKAMHTEAPPIVVVKFGSEYCLIDVMHRIQAAREKGVAEILSFVGSPL